MKIAIHDQWIKEPQIWSVIFTDGNGFKTCEVDEQDILRFLENTARIERYDIEEGRIYIDGQGWHEASDYCKEHLFREDSRDLAAYLQSGGGENVRPLPVREAGQLAAGAMRTAHWHRFNQPATTALLPLNPRKV